jgi:hypothetical protein
VSSLDRPILAFGPNYTDFIGRVASAAFSANMLGWYYAQIIGLIGASVRTFVLKLPTEPSLT